MPSEPRPSTEAEDAPLLVQNGVEESETNWLHSKRSLSTLEKILLGIILFLLLSTSLGFALFAGQIVKNRHSDSNSPNPPEPGQPDVPIPNKPPIDNDQLCLTPVCVQIAAEVLQGLDVTVDPCQDFYQFANGGWLKSHPIPEDKGLFGIAQMIDSRNKQILHDIIDSPLNKSLPQADQTNLIHLKDFYSSCLDENALDRIGSKPLIKLVNQLLNFWHGDAHITSDLFHPEQALDQTVIETKLPKKPLPGKRSDRLTAAILYLQSLGVSVLFSTYLDGDVKLDPNLMRIWLAQSNLGLPDPDYYKDKMTLEVYQEIVRATLGEVYSDAKSGYNPSRDRKPLSNLAYDIVTLEKKLAAIMWDAVDLEDPLLTYNPIRIDTFAKQVPLMNWRNLFSGFSPRPTFPDPLIIATPSYFNNLTAIIDQASDETLEGYLIWRLSQEYGVLLGPKSLIKKEVDYLNNYLTGVKEGIPIRREDTCLQALLDNAGFLVGRYYVQQAFSLKAKSYAENIIKATIQAFKERLPDLDWLDEKTRNLAEEKASAITQKIGFPTSPNTLDALAIQRYYALQEPFSVGDYFGNVQSAKVANVRRDYNKIGAKRDNGEWEMIPSEVNAYYTPSTNQISFPSGILQDPYFNKDWPEYLAFGAFPAGHELTHAFDSNGRQYDKNGILVDWWTNTTTAKFEELQNCILDQYAEYAVHDAQGRAYHVNSKFTVGEDVADAGGIAQSFRAWRDRYEGDTKGEQYDNYLLPGLDYTREQLFFVAFARGWARNIKPAEAVRRIRTDPHSPTWVRVVGTLSNSDEFSEAFNCPVGSPMSRKNKCKVW